MNFSARNLPIMRMHHAFAVICCVCILLSSCGSSAKSVALAQQNVEQFHSQLDSEQYAAVYAACDEKFHQATSESDFVKILEAREQPSHLCTKRGSLREMASKSLSGT